MSLTERLLSFTLLGAEWVLWLLVVLSVASVAVMVERALALAAKGPAFENLEAGFARQLAEGNVSAARAALGSAKAPEVRVALAGLESYERGRTAVAEAMASAKSRERLFLERNLGVLGTLGNNAPFIGLFGTVLGIIKAFADLAKNSAGGAEVVMAGISEALVATAVGLLVAIPAVVAFNVFQGKVRRRLAHIDAIAHMILAARGDEASAPASAPSPARAGA
ncbi:MAG: MotA/TolQ/ExbB proton channel family protein [Myxococcales bacterium]|nr:MotA/TolQ/ExbB proton channel family protein [Myxococcales bacterium]